MLHSLEFLERFVNEYDGVSFEGSYCVFKPICENWGVKLYRTKSSRDFSYSKQQKAAEAGLGPRVGIQFETPDYYGFVTERAEIIFPPSPKDMEGYPEWEREFQKIDSEHKDEMNKVSRELSKIGVDFHDIHVCNIGRLHGKFICIDFG